jgi:hypothetical protein
LDTLKKTGLSKPQIDPFKAEVGQIGHLQYPEDGKYEVLQILKTGEVLLQYKATVHGTTYVGRGAGRIEDGLRSVPTEKKLEGKMMLLSKGNAVGFKLGEGAKVGWGVLHIWNQGDRECIA